MASYTIQVVLRDDVKHLGKSGELVRVKPGYARNYLLPRGLAAIATRGNIKQIEHEQRAAKLRAEKALKASIEAAKALRGIRVVLRAQAGEEGKLFGSIGTRDIAAALAEQGHEVDRKRIVLEEPIKRLGDFEVIIRLGNEVTQDIKVSVEPEG